MTNYYFSLIPQVCISAVFVTVTVCVMSILLAATRRVIRGLNTPKQAKNIEGKKWKTKRIEVSKDAEKKEA